MTHDFARQRAARNTRDKRGSAPPWLWFTSGLVLGVLLSFLVYLATVAPAPARPTVPSAAATSAPKAEPAAPPSKPTFTYYTELPQITTERPAQSEAGAGKESVSTPGTAAASKPASPAPEPAGPRADAAATSAASKTPPPSTPPDPPPVEVPEPVALSLQAGAFRDAADANRRRADITLLGYPARVETVSGGAEGVRYRVQVGPFKDAAALAGAKGALSDQGIDVR